MGVLFLLLFFILQFFFEYKVGCPQLSTRHLTFIGLVVEWSNHNPTSRYITMSGIPITVSRRPHLQSDPLTVRLGKSGLKVTRITLGCMSYGTGRYDWTLLRRQALS